MCIGQDKRTLYTVLLQFFSMQRINSISQFCTQYHAVHTQKRSKMTKTITVRLDENELESLKKRAKSEGIPPSSLAKRILSENLSDIVRTDILIRSIQEEILVVESMISMVYAFDKEVFATLLGRTDKGELKGAEKELAIKNREFAKLVMERYQNVAQKAILDGEPVFGYFENNQDSKQ